MWHNTFYVVPLRLIFKLLTQCGKLKTLAPHLGKRWSQWFVVIIYHWDFGTCLSVTWNAWSVNLDCFCLGGRWQLLHRLREAPWPSGQAIQGKCHQVGVVSLKIPSTYVLRHAKCVTNVIFFKKHFYHIKILKWHIFHLLFSVYDY